MQHEPPPEQPPVPTGAAQSAPNEVTVMFDQPLQSRSLDPANWSAMSGGNEIAAASGLASGSAIIVRLVSSAIFDEVRYQPPPFDVVGANGLPADGFVQGIEA